jgi:hypothetical protein
MAVVLPQQLTLLLNAEFSLLVKAKKTVGLFARKAHASI